MKKEPSEIVTIYKRIYKDKDIDLQYLGIILPLLEKLNSYSLEYLISKINSMLDVK